jgi:hypothetical protein
VSRILPISLLAILIALSSCGTDYPPIDSNISFNLPFTVDFAISNSAVSGNDTTLAAVGKIDTTEYIRNGTSGYLLRNSEVWKLELQSSDASFTLDQLGFARVLIGTDTIAFDALPPQATLDTTLMLTNKDITPYMRDTSFPASLQCHLKNAPANPVMITCSMTVVYTAPYQNF